MPAYFPRHTVEWKFEEPRAFRRLTMSLVEMAAITGVLLRIFRSFALTHGSNGWLYFGGMFAIGLLFLLLMLTAHLANFPIQRWAWRGPLFGLVEWGAEMATSFLLVWAGREPYGSVRATIHDWPAMSFSALVTRGLAVVLWTVLLAAIVQIVRRVMAASMEDEKEEATA